MKKLIYLLLPLFFFTCNNLPEQSGKTGFAQPLSPGQKDSIAISGKDTVHFIGTPYTVTYYNWVVSGVTSPKDTIPIPPPVIFKFNPLTTEVYNGIRGLNNFFGSQVFSYPASDNYYRYSWASLQTGANTYNWSSFDNTAKAAKAAGQKIFVRVGCVDNTAIGGYVTTGGSKSCYPAFVHTAMQSEAVKDWSDGTWWYPNWNSDSFLSSWESFVKAWSEHIIDAGFQNVIFSIDIGGYGNFLAEWNMYGVDEKGHGTVATAASQIRIIKSHQTYFPNYPLILNEATFDTRYCTDQTAYYAITASNAWGLMGFRSDHVAWYNTTAFDQKMMNRTYNGVNFLTEVRKRRLYAPCLAEPMNDVAGCTPPGGTPYQTMIDEVNYYGFSAISNEPNNAPATAKNNFMNASKASGFTIGLISAQVAGSTLTLNWNNTGVAPIYEDYDIYFTEAGQQVKGNFNLRTLMPGVATSVDQLSPGSYTLSIIVKDRNNYRKPLNLNIAGRQSDGSYIIGNVVVK